MEKKRIVILGSTGSIGRQALEVVDSHPRAFEVVGLAAGGNIRLLEEQVRRYRPAYAAVADPEAAAVFRGKVRDLPAAVLEGREGLLELAAVEGYDLLLAAIVGFCGLMPTLEAIRRGKTIALANKETLVAAGEVVMPLIRERGVSLIPVDSEHSAIFQCLKGEGAAAPVQRILLTASGGPFRGRSREELAGVGPEEALKHPRWQMGKKITIDSATLMNKGLEVIEARWLFDVGYDRIEVLVHPESIVHSLVEFADGSTLAQLGLPDMKVPIQYAFSYPGRWPREDERLDLAALGSLTFGRPDGDAFPCLPLAYEAGRRGGTMPAVLNAANEVAVQAFLQKKVEFTRIPHIIEQVMSRHRPLFEPNTRDILDADYWARQESLRALE